MKEYVLVYVEEKQTGSILFLHKNRPAWQANLLNLPGGSIEVGETVLEAAIRELREETGVVVNEQHEYIRQLGKIVDGDSVIHCIAVFIDDLLSLTTVEDQIPEWMQWENVKNSSKLIPNLKVIIPLMHMKMLGWEVVDNYRVGTAALHEIRIKIPT